MRIIISNQDRISGTDTDFKVQLNLPNEISSKYYDVYIEKVLVCIPTVAGDDTEPLMIDIYSDSLLPSSNIFSSASPSLLTSISQTSSSGSSSNYIASKENSVADFQTTNFKSIQHFKLCIDEAVLPNYNPDGDITQIGYFTNSDYNFPDCGLICKLILNLVEFEK